MKIETLLPQNGPGFVTFARGDNGKNQLGQQSTIDATLAVASEWNGLNPDRPFSVGHISKKGGGPLAPHVSHRLGVDIDVRPMRKDGKNQSVSIDNGDYDQALTTKLIELWWKNAPVQSLFFNDQTVINKKLSRAVDGHRDHFHVRLRMKGATIKIGDRGSDVAELQTKLNIPADGIFGPSTQLAVENFQAANGLTPDGVVGPKTWAKLG